MEMSAVMAALSKLQKQLEISDEKFAHRAGVSVSTYSRQKHEKQVLGMNTIKGYAQVARDEKDTNALRALAAFAIGLEPDQIEVKI